MSHRDLYTLQCSIIYQPKSKIMKKITLLIAMMLAVAGMARGQMIEDFEHIELNWFAAGAESYMRVVPNPAPDETNLSSHVVEFRRGHDGDPWAGFWTRLPEPLDLTEHHYVYVDVWKPVISPVVFKLEPDDAPDVEYPSMYPQTKVEEWETLVFDFSEHAGLYEVIAFFPDFPETLDLEEDITIYFDNIRVGGPPAKGNTKDGADFVWCDFEDEFTNVGGFRETFGDNAEATDVPEGGIDGGTALKLNYLLEESGQRNGYQMWSWSPEAPITVDVSDYTHFVIHIKADVEIEDALIVLRDHVGELDNGSHHTFNIGTEWQEIVLPLNDFTVATYFEELADLSQLHLVRVMFDHDTTSVLEAEVHIDMVGFTTADMEPGEIAYVVDNFEHIELNVMQGGEEDDSQMFVVPNPDKGAVNPSSHVVEFRRSQHGVPWGGFWSELTEPVDLSENKYVAVDVWKPRISPIRFKMERGPTPDLEIESMEPQTKVEEWETIVFDFTELTGEWSVIAFMPDFNDPVDLEEDIVIYFDNIRVVADPEDVVEVKEPETGGFDLRIYPNPARDVVRIETWEGASVQLVSITGSILNQVEAADGAVNFDVSGLPQGIYLIRVSHEGMSAAERLFVY